MKQKRDLDRLEPVRPSRFHEFLVLFRCFFIIVKEFLHFCQLGVGGWSNKAKNLPTKFVNDP